MDNCKQGKIDISFIIPIYNLEKFLMQCIESILNVDFGNYTYEILLINDGSTDSSEKICVNYVNKYNNIHYYFQKNSGVSCARNFGINKSLGKYIMFFDGDDFLKGSNIVELIKLCYDLDLDIIRADSNIYDEKTGAEINKVHKRNCLNTVMLTREYIFEAIRRKDIEIVPWSGLFKRDYLLQYNILFPEGIGYTEDHLFFLKALLCKTGAKIFELSYVFYTYRSWLGSVTKKTSLKQGIDAVNVTKQELNFIDSLKTDRRTKNASYKYASATFYQSTSIYGRLSKEERKTLYKASTFKTKIKCLNHSFDFHQFIKLFMFTFFRHIVSLIYKIKFK